MKKLLLSICMIGVSVSSVCAEGGQRPSIADYSADYKQSIIDLISQDPLSLFVGSSVVKKGFVPEDQFVAMSKQEFEKNIDKVDYKGHLLFDGDDLIAFIGFYKDREVSIESTMRFVKEENLPMAPTAEQLRAVIPGIKETDAECCDLIRFNSLFVAPAYRNKGYGKELLERALQSMKELWPTVTSVQLDVDKDNDVACRLYEKHGFELVPVQNPGLASMGVVSYKKDLA